MSQSADCPYGLPALSHGVYHETTAWASDSVGEYRVVNEEGKLLMTVKVVAELDDPNIGRGLRRWLARRTGPRAHLKLVTPEPGAASV